MSTEWTVVNRRQKIRHQHDTVAIPNAPHIVASSSAKPAAPHLRKLPALITDDIILNSYTPTVRQALQPIIVRLQKCYDTLLQSDFLRQFDQALKYVEAQELFQLPEQQTHTTFCWRHIRQLKVYGLGSPSSRGDKVTCSQLAFACWLRTKLPNLQDPSTMFDPVFNRLDTQLLQALKFEVPEREDDHAVNSHTLFFMPHCPRSLYNAVLGENWTSQQLQQIVVLGNSFHKYAQPSILRSRHETPYHLLEVISSRTAWELAIREADYPVTSAFNDLSLHLFPLWKIARTPNPPA